MTLFGGKKKVTASYIRYRALGLELIPVYRQSARRAGDRNSPFTRYNRLFDNRFDNRLYRVNGA